MDQTVLHPIIAENLACAVLINQQKGRMTESLHAVQIQKIADLAALYLLFWKSSGLFRKRNRSCALRRGVKKEFIYEKGQDQKKENEKENSGFSGFMTGSHGVFLLSGIVRYCVQCTWQSAGCQRMKKDST